ncbi:MAG: SIS domain-containing protein [Planctomycetes bacterium]|nr:SIS domain-containing protein [Planctomycetota bacterium]
MAGYDTVLPESRDLILAELATALGSVKIEEIERFIAALENAETIFCIGVGRVALAISAMVKRLNHLGFTAYMVGDLSEPAATEDDLVVIASGSGETAIPVAIAGVAKKKGVPIAYIGSNRNSTIAGMATLMVRIPVATKLNLPDEIPSGQIMSSLFEQSLLLFADTVALAYARKSGLDLKLLWKRHANLE